MRTVVYLMALTTLDFWTAPGALARTPTAAQTDIQSEGRLPDPFYPGLPSESVKIRYRISGRFVGQEILAAKAHKTGVLKVREIRCTDTALGLERPIHPSILETAEKLVRLDLVQGRQEVYPNLRKYLSLAWRVLTDEQKANLAKNLPSVGSILGRDMRIGVAVADESGFLGLPGIKVALGSGRTWYWTKSDLVIRSLGYQGGFGWNKEAIDIIQDQDLDDSLFRLPLKEGGSDRLEVTAEDREWARMISQRIIDLLARPLLGQEENVRTLSKKRITYQLAIPWPFPNPPGFKDGLARYRLDPNWAPYPKPPDARPWPPPGLGISILKIELQEIADLLAERMPALTQPEKK